MVPDSDDSSTPLVLIVNVRGRWREVQRGECTDVDAVLGDWNLADRDIDPGRVRAVLGYSERTIVRAWSVDQPQTMSDYDRPRVRFTPQVRLHHLEGMASPYAWRRGEMYPVVALPLDQLDFDLEPTHRPLDLGATGEATIGGYTLRVTPHSATVLVPPGAEVKVKSLLVFDPATAGEPQGWRPGQAAE